MKKVSLAIGFIAVVIILGLGLFQVNQAEADPELSINTIKEQLTSQYPGTIKLVELDTKDGNYWVEMETETANYRLKVDGDTSRVLQIDKKNKPEEKRQKEKHQKDNQEEEVQNEKKESNEEEEPVNEQEKVSNNAEPQKQQEQIAKKTEVKKEEIVEAKTKEKAEVNTKEKNNVKTAEKPKKKPAILSREAAVKIALSEFSGTIEEVELDDDDGKLRYEIEIVNGETEAEIEIDAYTGKIIIIEIDD